MRYPVPNAWYAQRSHLPCLLLWDQHLPHRARSISAFLQVPRQFPKPPLYSPLLDVLHRFAVHSGGNRRSGVPPARLRPIRPLATPCRSTNRIESLGIPSLSHVVLSEVSERYLELLGFHQSPCPCLLVAPFSNQGPFPLPALPGFSGTTGLSATPPAQAGPRGFPVGACAPPSGLPVLLLSPSCTHAAANTPAEPVGARVARFPTAASLPRFNGGSASALPVSRPARRSLSLPPACSLSRPWRPFVIEVLQSSSLPPRTAPTASGWSDSCRAGFAPAGTQRLSTAHEEPGLPPGAQFRPRRPAPGRGVLYAQSARLFHAPDLRAWSMACISGCAPSSVPAARSGTRCGPPSGCFCLPRGTRYWSA